MSSKQAVFSFGFLILLAILSCYFVRSNPEFKLSQEALTQTPDTIVKALTIRRYNEQGDLISILEAPEMQHTAQDNSHWLSYPKIWIYEPNQPATNISSEEATTIHGMEQVTFLHHVVVQQSAFKSQLPSTLKTEKLLYFPKRKKATTDLEVEFEQGGSVVHSQGMVAYLDSKQIQLGRARALIIPKKHAQT